MEIPIRPINRKHLSYSFCSSMLYDCSAQKFFEETLKKPRISWLITDVSKWAHKQIDVSAENKNPEIIKNPNWDELRDIVACKEKEAPDVCKKGVDFEGWKSLCMLCFDYALRQEIPLYGNCEVFKRKTMDLPKGEIGFLGYIDCILERPEETILFDCKMKASAPTALDAQKYRLQMCSYYYLTGIPHCKIFCTYWHNRKKEPMQKEYSFFFSPRDIEKFKDFVAKVDFMQKSGFYIANYGFKYCKFCQFKNECFDTFMF